MGFGSVGATGTPGASWPDLYHRSALAITGGRVFPNVDDGERGFGVIGVPDIDAIMRFRYSVPEVLPPGSPNFRALCRAAANTGAAKFDIQWALVNIGEVPSAAALNSEGTQTVTFGAGDSGKYKQLYVPLDAAAWTAGRELVLDFKVLTSGFTLSAISTWFPLVRWR